MNGNILTRKLYPPIVFVVLVPYNPAGGRQGVGISAGVVLQRQAQLVPLIEAGCSAARFAPR